MEMKKITNLQQTNAHALGFLYYKNEFQQYLGKYAFIKRETRFWKVPRHTNSYVSNKWPLKYSLKFLTLVQYFFVLGNSIFLHFRSVSNT
ncbi:hypothetical protein T07_4401 [Trichinella nelsoni]|uniref:Uncharacterized protein n=1 Tax=Trichinella nelsoni TaxID=6336 RepID=A0A0V0SPK3_9BILA|nr:hypothetical protein T07_4401 [Trichinella nelsoni]